MSLEVQMQPMRRILVAFHLPEALHDLLEGVSRFVRDSQKNWQVFLCSTGQDFRAAFQRSYADGAITGIGTRSRALITYLRRTRTPAVNVVRDLTPVLPSVLSDNRALGAAGARYFRQRGFRHFAFAGVELPWSLQRQEGFFQNLGAPHPARHKLQLRLSDFQHSSKVRAQSLLRRWLGTLPDKTAVLCACDFIARHLVTVCQARDIRVPENIAILGIDNFPGECQMGPIAISSVAQDFQRIGYEAAGLLDQIMSDRKFRPPAPILVPPGRLHVRTSTDVLAFEDPMIVEVLKLIHQNAPSGITMKELLVQVPLSRKWLDIRFKEAVGHTPSEEIRRCRMEGVRNLLLETNMPVRQIATQCRFSCVQNLIRCFRRAYGLSPEAYRRRIRVEGGHSSIP
jgi:LacI family transcriptional regulator